LPPATFIELRPVSVQSRRNANVGKGQQDTSVMAVTDDRNFVKFKKLTELD